MTAPAAWSRLLAVTAGPGVSMAPEQVTPAALAHAFAAGRYVVALFPGPAFDARYAWREGDGVWVSRAIGGSPVFAPARAELFGAAEWLAGGRFRGVVERAVDLFSEAA